MMQFASYSNIGGRTENEDSVLRSMQDDRLCLVVADGLGGHGGGKIASSAAVNSICSEWDGTISQDTLKELIVRAHDKVCRQQSPIQQMKTTVVALLLADQKSIWAHVGDSRLYHFHNGKLVFQTTDHSVSQIAVMLGDITPDQIRFHPDRSRILRALGQEDGPPNITLAEETLPPGQHAFLLCTDGFWEYVLEEEMEDDLRQATSPALWISRMRDRLEARIPEQNDNNTAAAVWTDIR